MHPHVHYSIVYNSKDTETTRVFIDGWVDVYIY